MAQIEYTYTDRAMLGYGHEKKGSVMSRIFGASLIASSLVLCGVISPQNTTSLVGVVVLCATLLMAGLSCFMFDPFKK